MDFGFNMPSRGPQATRDGIFTIARRAEQLGYNYLAVTDHIVVPRDIASRYPYSQDGEFPGKDAGEYVDPLSLMAFLAAATEDVRLLTSVMVVPYRPAVLTAKMLATIDVMSGGRITIACGAGWMREEFEAIGAPPYEERGKVTDEYIDVFRELWTKDDPVFDGAYNKFSNIAFLPKPLQKPHPPIWTGGESGPALRRAARIADGWYPIGANPRFPLDTIARYKDKLDEFKSLAEGYGRDPNAITRGYWANWYQEGASREADTGERMMFTGADDDVVGDITALGETGVSLVMVNFAAPTIEETIARMERFAAEIMPHVNQ